MFKNCSECFSTGAFCNGQVMFVDGEAVASHATDNAALMRLADYLEQETDDTYLKVYSLGDDFWDNDAYCVTSDPERVRRAMESGGKDVYKRQVLVEHIEGGRRAAATGDGDCGAGFVLKGIDVYKRQL